MDEADHHLVGRRLAPHHVRRRIGVRQVVGRVVERGVDANGRAGRNHPGLSRRVGELPVEVVLRHVEQNVLPAVGVLGREPHRFAAQVHVRREVEEHRLVLGGVRRPRLVVAVARRNVQRRIHQPQRLHHVLGLLVVEVEAHGRLVGAASARARSLVVVHLEEQRAVRRHAHPVPFGKLKRRNTGSPAAHEGEVQSSRPALHAGECGVGRREVGQLVMHRFDEPGVDLDRPDPAFFVDRVVHLEPLVVILDVIGDLELRSRVDGVRRTELPVRREAGRLRRPRKVTGRRARGHPTAQCLDLGVGEARVLHELPVLRVGEPRWHGALGDDPADRLRPGAGLVVGQERHGRGLSGSMTARAVLVQDRCDVVRPGHLSGVCRVVGCRRGDHRAREEREAGNEDGETVLHGISLPGWSPCRRRV